MTPMEALQSATINAAHFMGLAKSDGSIAEGKKADLIVLDASPLDDISNTKRIHAVMFAGKVYNRDDLNAMLAKVERIGVQTLDPAALNQVIAKQDIQSAIKELRELQVIEPDAAWEQVLSTLSERLIAGRKTKEAIEVLKLNAEFYSRSSHAFDRLAEAHLMAGERELAKKHTDRALLLDAESKTAKDRLEKLTKTKAP